jgi:hypothetical protein
MFRNEIIVGLDDSPSSRVALRLRCAARVMSWHAVSRNPRAGLAVRYKFGWLDRESLPHQINKVFKQVDPRPDNKIGSSPERALLPAHRASCDET